jgi:hypothetical protein
VKWPSRVFWLAFAGYFLLAGAWALALPVNGTYDEKQHIVRAYAVASGQWISHGRTVDASGWPATAFTAPRSLLPTTETVDCTWDPDHKPLRPPASCQVPVTDRTEGTMPSIAGRYHPVYYLPVGLPLLISPDSTGVLWARLVSALLSALLFAVAAAIAARLGSRPLMLGLVLVATPTAVNLAGAVNPNGLEISAGALLFVALLALLRSPTVGTSVAAGAAGALLITVRQLGPVLFALVLAACLTVHGWRHWRRAARDRIFAGIVGAGLVAAVAWLVAARTTEIQPLTERQLDLGPGGILGEIATERGEFYVRQIVAQFGYGETLVSSAMIGAWYLLVAALVVPVLWLGGRRLRLVVIGIGATCAVFLVGLELYFVPIHGWFSQGRYAMPLGVGVVLVAAAYAEPLSARLGRREGLLAAAVALATLPLDLYALARVMTRYQRAIDAGLDPFGGSWQPAAGPLVPLAACVAGALLLTVTVLVIRSSIVRPAADHSTQTAQPTTVGRSHTEQSGPMAH